jgi:plastocyanin
LPNPAGPPRAGIRPALVCVATLLAGVAPHADSLTGTVEAVTRPGAARGRAIVFAEPLDGSAPLRPAKARLEQKDKQFRPAVLAVPVGSTIEFPNLDPIFHNVFSLTPPQPFDLGLYRGGASRTRTFAQPGYYWVFCNIHPQMAAFLAVVPTPWLTLADEQGRYRLDVPPGRYRVTAVSERGGPSQIEVVVRAGGGDAAAMRLDETRFVSLEHRNKHGQPYPASAYEGPRRP